MPVVVQFAHGIPTACHSGLKLSRRRELISAARKNARYNSCGNFFRFRRPGLFLRSNPNYWG
jgi:hypothetical protein